MIKPSTYKVELIGPLAGCRHEVLKVLKVHPKLIANSESGSIASLSFTPDKPSFQSTGMQFQCYADFWTWFARIGILLLSNPAHSNGKLHQVLGPELQVAVLQLRQNTHGELVIRHEIGVVYLGLIS